MFAVGGSASWLDLPSELSLWREEQEYGIHGGLVEGSLTPHLRLDPVQMRHATDF